jgi:hypothetical protein
MSAFLVSVRDDLLDRRLRPYLVVLGVALAGALVYAAIGGSGGGSPTPAPPTPRGSSGEAGGLAISTASSATKPIAETTNGGAQQHHGAARNPFTPLAGPTGATGASATASAAGGASSGARAGSGASSSGTGGAAESGGSSPTTPKPSTPSKPPAPAHAVVAQFGVASGGSGSGLTSYEDLRHGQRLPSAKQPLLRFQGVTSGGGRAIFKLLSAPILHGGAVCSPSPTQCQSIELAVGKSEQLEYLSPAGQPTTYELRVVSIASSHAKAASAHGARGRAGGRGRHAQDSRRRRER